MEKLTDIIKSVELLQAQPGDVVVCTVDDGYSLSLYEMENQIAIIKSKLPAEVEVIFFQGITMKLLRPELISQEDLRALKKYELGAPDDKTD